VARIVVHRVYATTASLVSVTLNLDGVKQGRVKSGSILTIDAAEGVHQLRAHLQWQASNPLSVVLQDNDDEVSVELTTSQNPDDPADMGVFRSLLHPRSAFTLRLKDER
jgi:hypothetical protein